MLRLIHLMKFSPKTMVLLKSVIFPKKGLRLSSLWQMIWQLKPCN